jgi:hypothetical protein
MEFYSKFCLLTHANKQLKKEDIFYKNGGQNSYILLIEIPYTDFDIIDWEYLKNKLGL